MKTFKTSKKFYKKWLFKVSLHIVGSSAFRTYGLDYIKSLCQVTTVSDYNHWSKNVVIKNRQSISRVVACLESKDSRLWTKRIERDYLDIYTNDKEFYETISTDLADLVTQRYEPDEICINLLDNPKSIICDKLPHNRYNYRVYLRPHKFAGDYKVKQKLIDWMVLQSPKITCTPAVQQWIMNTNWNWDRRYVLVEDEGALLMLKLRSGEMVGTVYNYVVVDK